MTSLGRERFESPVLRRVRWAALVALAGGATGSAALMLYVGQRVQAPRLLRVLFTLWVLAPFMLLALASVASTRWSAHAQAALAGVTLIVAALSLVVYGVAALDAHRPPTAIFVLVPPVSSLLTTILVSVVGLIARQRSR